MSFPFPAHFLEAKQCYRVARLSNTENPNRTPLPIALAKPEHQSQSLDSFLASPEMVALNVVLMKLAIFLRG